MENAQLVAAPRIQRQDTNIDFQPFLTAWTKPNHFKNENERLNREETEEDEDSYDEENENEEEKQ